MNKAEMIAIWEARYGLRMSDQTRAACLVPADYQPSHNRGRAMKHVPKHTLMLLRRIYDATQTEPSSYPTTTGGRAVPSCCEALTGESGNALRGLETRGLIHRHLCTNGSRDRRYLGCWYALSLTAAGMAALESVDEKAETAR